MADEPLEPKVWGPSARTWPPFPPPDWEQEARERKQQERDQLEQQRRDAAANATD